MRCPYLTGRKKLLCTINGWNYSPSLFELMEYCKTERHKKCPFLWQRGHFTNAGRSAQRP